MIRLCRFAVLLLLATLLHAAAPVKPVPFDVHDGYFVSNKFEPDAAESFVSLSSQQAFDKVFGAGFVMRDKSHRLPEKAFESRMVIAAIKRGKAMWEFKVRSLTVENGVVILKYSAQSQPQPNTTYAVPLIVSIPKGAYRSIRFIENENAEHAAQEIKP